MTRAKILEMTSETDRRLAANEIGVAPTKEKHQRRFAELKRQQEILENDLSSYDRYVERARYGS